VFVEGEELVYNVRYTFIDLGQIRIKTTGDRIEAPLFPLGGKGLFVKDSQSLWNGHY
jgi:porphobilinogen deaminase